MASTIRREVDILDQKIKEDIQTLKHEYVYSRPGISKRYPVFPVFPVSSMKGPKDFNTEGEGVGDVLICETVSRWI